MKHFAPILMALLIIVCVIVVLRAASGWTEAHQAAWQVEASAKAVLNVQDYQDELRNAAERRAWFTEFYRAVFTALLIVFVASVAVYLWKVYDQRKESWARAVDGTFALQSFSNGQVRWQIDPNKQLTGTTGFQKATGLLGEFSSAAGADRQLTYNTAIQRTRTASAVTSGEGFKYAATGKFLGGMYDSKRDDYEFDSGEEVVELPVTWQALTAQDAFAQSAPDRWILGQSPASGELFELNPKEAAHFGIVGATGTGKTAYTALLLMAYALKNKYRIVILDGKGGADWSKYQHVAEYISLDYSNVGGIVKQMVSEYTKRQAILNQHGVNSIWELPAGAKPRPTLFIVDEFGAVMDSLRAANKTAYKGAELDLGNLLRLSRGAGLYVVLCDQNPSRWPGTVRANLPMNLAYRLGGGIGNAVQEYNLDRLERVGQFQVSNEIYNAFPTYEVIDQLLPDGTYKKPLALLTIDSTIAERGGDKPRNDSNPTPQRDSTIDSITPVSDSTINSMAYSSHSNDSGDDSGDSAINKPRLANKPMSQQERDLVVAEYQLQGSINKTCEALWGSWTVSRGKWAKEILQEKGLLQ